MSSSWQAASGWLRAARERRVRRLAHQQQRQLLDPRQARLSAGALIFWVWLVALPLVGLRHASELVAWLGAAGIAVFASVYVRLVERCLTDRGRLAIRVLMLGCLVAIAVAGSSGQLTSWGVLFSLSSIAAAVALPDGGPALAGIVAIAGASAGLDIAHGAGVGASDQWGVFIAGFVVWILRRFFAVISDLQRAREELATFAVTQERLRFARDLHDLLGHTLSLVVVKAEVVRRLATRDPNAAADEAGDIESIGRQALSEIRQAVTGYREQGLTAELDGARRTLAAADIDAVVRTEGPPVPPEIDTMLGWVVREAITNVIRHSAASNCTIVVQRGVDRATVEIEDDGHGVPTGRDSVGGNGLCGLGERVESCGGTLVLISGSTTVLSVGRTVRTGMTGLGEALASRIGADTLTGAMTGKAAAVKGAGAGLMTRVAGGVGGGALSDRLAGRSGCRLVVDVPVAGVGVPERAAQ